MKDIGHFDFGENLLPVNFDDWMTDAIFKDPNDVNFWIEYWIAAYSHILKYHRKTIHLLDYLKLTDNPLESLAGVSELIQISDKKLLTDQHDFLRPPRKHEIETDILSPSLMQKARGIYSKLIDHSMI